MKLNLKISVLIFLVCFLFQNSYSQQNTNGWYWINGQPQGNTLNWVKKIDATNYYAVGEAGTFMKSSDGGDSWLINSSAGVEENLFGSLGTLRLYSGWFFNANTGIVVGQSVSGDGGIIRRTTNGGLNFTSINLGIASGLSRVSDIYFINSTTGYICGNNTVKAFKTTDAGLTWTLLPNLPSLTLNYKCIYVRDESNIILGCETDGNPGTRRIVRTTNAGGTWKVDTLPGTTIHTVNDIEFLNASTGFLACSGSYFGFTTNGGANWTQAIFPVSQASLNDIEITGSVVNVLGSSTSYYTTTNLGVTWDSVNYDDLSNVNQPYPAPMNSFNISGSDVIVAGTNGKINISNDGGFTWRNKNYTVGNANHTFSSIDALPGTGQVWAGSGGGLILYSSNNGTNWTQQQTPAFNAIYEIEMLNSNSGYAAGGSFFQGVGYCFKTTNRGTTWTTLPITSPTSQVNSLDFVNVNTGWIVGWAGISKTTNGGSTWTTQVTTPLYSFPIAHINMFDANTGYTVSNNNVWKTTNGGNNWDRLTTLPVTLAWNKVQTFSPTTLYLGGTHRIYKSFDGGATWDSAFIPSALPTIFNMDWFDLNSGTIVGTAGYSAKTSNGGITWTERNPGSSTLTDVSMVSKDTVYAVCDRNVQSGIFRLYDVNTSITFNLTVGIEGFWNGTVQVGDTVKCHLRNSVSPYNEIEVVAAVINNTGSGTFIFSTSPSSSYYLEITHRNSIETWSGLPQSVVQGSSYNYNFTTSSSQAFGNNMILKSGRYCNYSGDVNQDGSVTLTDLVETYNASSNFQSGYAVADVNGDNIVDLSDLTIVYNNSANFVAKVTP